MAAPADEPLSWPSEVLAGNEGAILEPRPKRSRALQPGEKLSWYDQTLSIWRADAIFVRTRNGSREATRFDLAWRMALTFPLWLPVMLMALVFRAADRVLRAVHLLPPLIYSYKTSPLELAICNLLIVAAKYGSARVRPDGQVLFGPDEALGPRFRSEALKKMRERLLRRGKVEIVTTPVAFCGAGQWEILVQTTADDTLELTSMKFAKN